MLLTLTLICQFCVGATFALACRHVGATLPFYRGPALLALGCYELALVIPPCAYVLWRFPDALSGPVYAAIVLGLAWLGYVLAYAALIRGNLALGGAVAATGMLLLPLAAWLHGHDVLNGVATRDNAHMVALWRVVWPLQGVGWAFCLWRLNLYDRVQRKAQGLGDGPSSLQLISAQILSAVRPPGTRKHEPRGGGPSA